MKKILFITGTRADYGKIKPVMKMIEADNQLELAVFVTGMHMLSAYGSTYKEVLKDNFANTYLFINQGHELSMDLTLGNTINGLSNYIKEVPPDLIVIHGDRLEALAGVIVGAMNNIFVAHIEGGELSGTIDESIRHAITKMSHIHLVANEDAKARVMQMGEDNNRVFVVGSPDIDIMLHANLPDIKEIKKRYEIPFSKYAIAMFHPVTTDYHNMRQHAKNFVEALVKSGDSFVLILPNNDSGKDFIIEEYEKLKENPNFCIYPSLRFEYFLELLKNAQYIIGNSSAGVREAGVYAVPAIDIGDRQKNRYATENIGIISTNYSVNHIVDAIERAKQMDLTPTFEFGDGNSSELITKILKTDAIWNMSIQKVFVDID